MKNEYQANETIYAHATELAAERARWARVLAKPAARKPAARKPMRRVSLLRSLFGR